MTLGPIGAVRVFVTDLVRARQFYGDALGLSESWSSSDAATYAPGGCHLVIETCAGEEASAMVGRFTGVSFTVEDIAAAVSMLETRGVTFDGPPATQPWGGVLAHFADPDGNILTLAQYPPRT